jgi:hypothetical protein
MLQSWNRDILKGDLQGEHWNMLRSILPPYQALTTVDIKDGSATSFWNDVWHLDEALADGFLAIYRFQIPIPLLSPGRSVPGPVRAV